VTDTEPRVRTRFEPSPSGSIHVGTAMIASFNWYLARKHGGTFVLRVADTDRSRVVPEGLRSVTEDLAWLGLDWDEGPEVGGPHAPYFQSERVALYGEAAEKLLAGGHAYRCFCTPEELDAIRARQRAEKRPPRYEGRCRDLSDEQRVAFEAQGRSSVIRFRVPEGETTVTDLVRGEVTFRHADLDDFVILRADGSALYQLAVSYDDMTMAVTRIIRGEDIFASTPKQVLLIRAMGGEPPLYGHAPLIVGPDRKPLSKRHGSTAIGEFRHQGFLPEVILNYLATLDWSIGDGTREKFTIPELIEHFEPAQITRNPSAFDHLKLEAWNGDRIRELPGEQLAARIEAFLVREGVLADPVSAEQRAVILTVTPLIQERMKRLDEAPPQLRFFFHEPEPDERAAGMMTPEHAPTLEAAVRILEQLEPFEAAAIQEALSGWAEEAGLKKKVAFQPIRAAVTGSLVSPPLFESLEILGRERAIARLGRALARAQGS